MECISELQSSPRSSGNQRALLSSVAVDFIVIRLSSEFNRSSVMVDGVVAKQRKAMKKITRIISLARVGVHEQIDLVAGWMKSLKGSRGIVSRD